MDKSKNDVIKNLEKEINNSFNNKRFHTSIKLSLVLLNLDNDNLVGKDILEKSKKELSDTWYMAYSDSFIRPLDDPYREYDDGYNKCKKDFLHKIYSVIGIIILLILTFLIGGDDRYY